MKDTMKERSGVKSQKSTENEVGKHSLVLNSEQSQFTQLLIEHGITSNEQLSKSTIRRLLTIPGITPELAHKILSTQV